ncbi:hypothetical protein GH714_037527 [Hevea brasiliensis]|uniref:F-box protein n=1 Tax=Hevea brasiliensis TaxID=3981 RepID=A0A6A6LTH1_HEVBR|nr:hypothetical protein GH714_037527 [Hevea brasiliensis]
MASLQASNFLSSSSSRASSSSKRINAAISVPKLLRIRFPVPKTPSTNLVEDLLLRNGFTNTKQIEKSVTLPRIDEEPFANSSTSKATAKLYAILEAVADRVEMHKNVGEQRDNWNKLLLNSINMITLTATTMAGVAATGGAGAPLLALKLSSTLLFTAAMGMQLYSQIQTTLALYDPTELDVKDAMDKINKILAISGPLLTGIAAAGSAFVGNGSWAAIVAVAAGALASTVNTFEHSGQVGMVVEMYRNCAGFFSLVEESIKSSLEETDIDRREDGEMFELKVALQLGRSMSELRDLAQNPLILE